MALGVAPERIPTDQQAATAFYRTVLADRRVLVIVTLRADFMGRVAGEHAFAAVVEQNLQIVSPMERPDLRRAID